MTLIAGYIINSCPVLLGDVLVSNPNGKGKSISTPTWNKVEEAQQEPLQIVRIVQKVNVVHCCGQVISDTTIGSSAAIFRS